MVRGTLYVVTGAGGRTLLLVVPAAPRVSVDTAWEETTGWDLAGGAELASPVLADAEGAALFCGASMAVAASPLEAS